MTNLRAWLIAFWWTIVLPWGLMALSIVVIWAIGRYAVEIFGGLF